MEAISPVFAALGVVEFDALDDLAGWLDRRVGPLGTAETSGRPSLSGDRTLRGAGQSAGREA